MYQPNIFISHGAPDIAIRVEHPSHQFLKELPDALPRPEAIVIFSAHWCAGHIMISKASSYEAFYDFGGFDPRLYSMQYAPKGNPDIAQDIFNLLRKSDGRTELVDNSRMDHGAWIPLMLMYPEADIPVVQVSIQPGQLPGYHYDIGATLAELRRYNILIMGAGKGGRGKRIHTATTYGTVMMDAYEFADEKQTKQCINQRNRYISRSSHHMEN